MLIVIIQMFSSFIQSNFLFFNMVLVLYFLFILSHVYAFFVFLGHSFTSNFILETKEPNLLFHFISLMFFLNLPLHLELSFGFYRFQIFSFDLSCYVLFISFLLSNVCSMNYSLVIITLVPKQFSYSSHDHLFIYNY